MIVDRIDVCLSDYRRNRMRIIEIIGCWLQHRMTASVMLLGIGGDHSLLAATL
jgi:hypothetical protein